MSVDNQVEVTLNASKSEHLESNSESASINPKKVENIKIVGKITEQIGTGDDAKHSIIWTTIRWCFIIASAISLILFVFLGFAYKNDNQSEIVELKKFIFSIWSIFTPIITLALGYAFGKDYK
ncbi:TPA: hypothetical protein ACNIH0_000755 [Acinetobacter baumannii]|nr:hypothetical protein [Acinetobacter baumannii]